MANIAQVKDKLTSLETNQTALIALVVDLKTRIAALAEGASPAELDEVIARVDALAAAAAAAAAP